VHDFFDETSESRIVLVVVGILFRRRPQQQQDAEGDGAGLQHDADGEHGQPRGGRLVEEEK